MRDKESQLSEASMSAKARMKNYSKRIYQACFAAMACAMCSTQVFAAEDMWSKAKTIMNDVYTKVLGISTITAVSLPALPCCS